MALQDLFNLLKGQPIIDPTQMAPTPTPDPFIAKGLYKTGPNSYSNVPPTTTPQVTPQTLQAAQGLNQQTTPTTQSIIPGYTNGKVPAQYGNMVLSAANKYGINPAVLAGIVQTENGAWSPGVKDNANIDPKTGQVLSIDRGFMQINNKAHPEISDQQARDPQFAIDFAAKTLAGHLKNLGDINKAIAAYNVGEGGASVSGQNPYGGGPRGQTYLNAVARNIDPNLAKQLGLKPGTVIPVK